MTQFLSPPYDTLTQGIDSQYIKYCEEESGYVLDPRLRLGLKERAIVTEMLEMGWLFTLVVRYNQSVDGEKKETPIPSVRPLPYLSFFISVQYHGKALSRFYRCVHEAANVCVMLEDVLVVLPCRYDTDGGKAWHTLLGRA